MDAHMILPTNATSAANPLAVTTPTAIALDTVIQTNREGEPREYREITTTKTILQPTVLEYAPTPNITTETKTTMTVEAIPKTTVIKEAPIPADYVVTTAGALKTNDATK